MSRKQARQAREGGKKLKVSYQVHVARLRGHARLMEGAPPPELGPKPGPEPKGTIPRISRLLALAHHIQELIDTGQVRDLAEVARCGHITRARMTQIMNLLLLAPDIQEEILFLPPTTEGKDAITLRCIRQVVGETSFARQRYLWHGSRPAASSSSCKAHR